MQFNALSVQQTIIQCADAKGFAWMPLPDPARKPRPLFIVSQWTNKPFPMGELDDIQGLCIKETRLCTQADTMGGASTHFREHPGQPQTISQCADAGGYAWWPLSQHYDAPEMEPFFFRTWKDMLAPLQHIKVLQGKCVEHIVGATSYVTVWMFPCSPTHWSQRKV
jgi:hypothetical protein